MTYNRLGNILRVIVTAMFAAALPASAAPMVAGFERFGTDTNTGVDPGLLLYNELKCAACHGTHSPAQAAFPTYDAPVLDNVGARIRLNYLQEFIAQPQALKPGTRMPDMMAGWTDDERAEASEALAHFLASQGGPMSPSLPVAETMRSKHGGALFHAVGCVACHEPQRKAGGPDTEDAFWDDSVETPEITVPSVPLPNLSKKTSLEALAAFLRDPTAIRPGGRMPNMTLTEEEAGDIAHWLIEQDTPAEEALTVDPAMDPARVARGQELFQQLNCASCHQLGDVKATVPATLLGGTPLLAQGCLAETPTKGLPWFDLSDVQRAALGAIKSAAKETATTKTARIDHTLLTLNCYACHERNGLGAPEPGRAAYFTETEDQDLGDEGRMPPTLTAVGSKLTPEWLKAILTDGGRVRPYMATRMPHFGEAHVAPLAEALLEVDKNPTPLPVNVTGLEHHHRSHYGRELMGTNGLGCVTCHNLNGTKSLGIPAVDLAFVPERLNPEWFMRYMLDPASLRPGTRMPAFYIDGKSQGSNLFNGDPRKQIEALWVYLREVKEIRLPEGMEDGADYELKPTTRPIVHRTFIENVGPYAIAVGFPEGIHFAYDARTMGPAEVWRGRFIDAESAQADRFTPFVKPLGESVVLLPEGPSVSATKDGPWTREGLRYRGYRLDDKRTPIFQYELGAVHINESLRPTEDGKSFQRKLVLTGPPQTVYVRIGKGEANPDGTYRVGKVTVSNQSGPPAIAGPEAIGWILPVEVNEAGTTIEQVISW